jgi:hypothetical protein
VTTNFGKNKPNPAHHNYGRHQNFNQRLSTRLSFVSFTLRGLRGNLTGARSGLLTVIKSKFFDELPEQEQLAIDLLSSRLTQLATECFELAEQAADINRSKTKLSKEKV